MPFSFSAPREIIEKIEVPPSAHQTAPADDVANPMGLAVQARAREWKEGAYSEKIIVPHTKRAGPSRVLMTGDRTCRDLCAYRMYSDLRIN